MGSNPSEAPKYMTKKERIKILTTYKSAISILQKQQDRLFRLAVKELGLKYNWDNNCTLLFDGLYNSSPSVTELEKRLWPVQDVKKSSGTKAAR